MTYDYLGAGRADAWPSCRAEGKGAFAEMLKKAERPMIILGRARWRAPTAPPCWPPLREVAERLPA